MVKPAYNKQYMVRDVELGRVIYLVPIDGEDKETFLIEFNDVRLPRLEIRASSKNSLSALRRNLELRDFVFLSKSRERISRNSEKKILVEEIRVKNSLYMKSEVDEEDFKKQTEAKKDQVQQDQKLRIASLAQLIDDVQNLSKAQNDK